MEELNWRDMKAMPSRKYTCGHCGMPLASERGWDASIFVRGTRDHKPGGSIYICHQCTRPTFFDYETRKQIPGYIFGKVVQNITDGPLQNIYEEARAAISAGCYTSAVLCCRKLLMHLAVAKGAKAGETFKSYVEYLEKTNLVPSTCKEWVDQIRDMGNEANHEIVMMKADDAEQLVTFCEMLLRIMYEFPAAALARKSGLPAAQPLVAPANHN